MKTKIIVLPTAWDVADFKKRFANMIHDEGFTVKSIEELEEQREATISIKIRPEPEIDLADYRCEKKRGFRPPNKQQRRAHR